MDNRSFLSGASGSPPSAPSSPSSGYPTGGNPATATPPTNPGDYWFHQVGEELRAVVVAAGLTPDRSDLTQLLQAITAIAAPSGVIRQFAMTAVPTGYLKCDGAAVSRTTYAALFAAIGTVWGVGDGSTTFNVPDLRGEFLRGWDDSRGVDSGRAFGSTQASEYESHTHDVDIGIDGGHTYISGGGDALKDTFGPMSTASSGGSETRPRNVAIQWCIHV